MRNIQVPTLWPLTVRSHDHVFCILSIWELWCLSNMDYDERVAGNHGHKYTLIKWDNATSIMSMWVQITKTKTIATTLRTTNESQGEDTITVWKKYAKGQYECRFPYCFHLFCFETRSCRLHKKQSLTEAHTQKVDNIYFFEHYISDLYIYEYVYMFYLHIVECTILFHILNSTSNINKYSQT